MEEWIPLFNIFLNSPTPESEASLWLQHSFNASSDPTITHTSFLSLLTKPTHAIVHTSPPHALHRIMWMETLPSLVQARILSFLGYDCQSFSSLELSKLAAALLGGKNGLDFWVRSGARNLLYKMSQRACELNPSVDVNSVFENEFYSPPSWLGSDPDPVLPWLPLPLSELKLGTLNDSYEKTEQSCMEVDKVEQVEDTDASQTASVDINVMIDGSLNTDLQRIAADLNARVLNIEDNLDVVRLADEIRQLCLGRRKFDSLALLELTQPWKADDEIMAILLSNLLNSNGEEELEELGWPSQVLCATLLPKLLALEEPVSRVLMSTTIDYCKLHERAAEYALLFPLMLRREGVNSPICDVVTRVMKECLNHAHITSFLQKLLADEVDVRRCICLPCHQPMIDSKLLWTEATFGLFQNILNISNVHLTKDSVDHLAYKVHELASRFARSLKFCNFLLCFVVKCFPLLKPHKHVLTGAASCTKTIVTKSILSKLDSL